MSEPDHSSAENAAEKPSRRTAIQLLTGTIGLLLNAIPLTIGGLFFLDPLFGHKHKSAAKAASVGPEGFVKLSITADVLPDDGTPVAVTVVADLVDAWSMYRNEPIGSVWLRRQPDGSLIAFNSTCPHLGCSVDYRGSDNDFYCPCHTSAFDLNGKKKNEIPPRGLDTLEIITATGGKQDDGGNELWIRYQEFHGATAERIPV